VALKVPELLEPSESKKGTKKKDVPFSTPHGPPMLFLIALV
jgi:hypothetical protein